MRCSLYWNGMVSPLLNLTAAGAILYEGELDVARDTNTTMFGCLLNTTLTTWMRGQGLSQVLVLL